LQFNASAIIANRTGSAGDQDSPEDHPAIGSFLARARDEYASAAAQDLRPLAQAIRAALKGDDSQLSEGLKTLRNKLPEIAAEIFDGKQGPAAMEKILSAALFTGLTEGPMIRNRAPILNADWNEAMHPRGAGGKFSDKLGPDNDNSGGASPSDPHRDNIEKGRKAMAEVIAKKSDVLGAMDRPGVGPVDFIWGHKGGGICHIIDKRNREGLQSARLRGQSGHDVAMMMPEVVARGKLSPPYADANGPKRSVEWNGYKAVLSLRRDGQRRAWLLSGFQKTCKPR
jgi:hypothetical protein